MLVSMSTCHRRCSLQSGRLAHRRLFRRRRRTPEGILFILGPLYQSSILKRRPLDRCGSARGYTSSSPVRGRGASLSCRSEWGDGGRERKGGEESTHLASLRRHPVLRQPAPEQHVRRSDQSFIDSRLDALALGDEVGVELLVAVAHPGVEKFRPVLARQSVVPCEGRDVGELGVARRAGERGWHRSTKVLCRERGVDLEVGAGLGRRRVVRNELDLVDVAGRFDLRLLRNDATGEAETGSGTTPSRSDEDRVDLDGEDLVLVVTGVGGTDTGPERDDESAEVARLLRDPVELRRSEDCTKRRVSEELSRRKGRNAPSISVVEALLDMLVPEPNTPNPVMPDASYEPRRIPAPVRLKTPILSDAFLPGAPRSCDSS